MWFLDVGGYTKEYPASEEKGLCWLRTTRVLEAGMVITVEPGLYFNESWVKQMIEKDERLAKFINFEELSKYYGTGGVRLEDDVLVTESGIDNLTVCPRTVEEIEAVMSKASAAKSSRL